MAGNLPKRAGAYAGRQVLHELHLLRFAAHLRLHRHYTSRAHPYLPAGESLHSASAEGRRKEETRAEGHEGKQKEETEGSGNSLSQRKR